LLQLVQDVQLFKKQCLEEEGQHDTIVLATKLCRVGYRVKTREAVGGGSDCLRNLRHTFLYVRIPGEIDKGEVLVEPHLREHFEIANPTALYRNLLDVLEPEFVGSVNRMVSIVQLVCEEMAYAFLSRNLLLPPWRQCKSMLSKWFPEQARDTEVEAELQDLREDSGSSFPWQDVATVRTFKTKLADDWIPFQYDKY